MMMMAVMSSSTAAPITTMMTWQIADVVLSSLLTMNQTMQIVLFNCISDSYRLFGSGEWKGRQVLTESGNATSRGNLLCTPGTGTPGWCKYCVVWNWRTSKSWRLICCPIASSGEGRHVASKANHVHNQHLLISSRRFSCCLFWALQNEVYTVYSLHDTVKFEYNEAVSVMEIYVIMKLYYTETH